MGQLALTDKEKFEKTKGTRGKPGRYIREIELENIYKQNIFLINIDENHFDSIIKGGFPNQISAEYFINWVVRQVKDADSAIKKVEGIDIEDPRFQVMRWVFYQRLAKCVQTVNSLLNGYEFKRNYKAEVKRILKLFQYLYKVSKPEERKLEQQHNEGLLRAKETLLLEKKANLLLIIEGLLISNESDDIISNREGNINIPIEINTEHQFSHVTKCLFHHLKPLVKKELSSVGSKRLKNCSPTKDREIFYLKSFDDSKSGEYFFTSLIYSSTEFDDNSYGNSTTYHAVSISLYENILDSLSLKSLDKLFDKNNGLNVVLADGGAYVKSPIRPTLFPHTYDLKSMNKEERKFHKRDRLRKISIFDEDYKEHLKKVKEMDNKYPPVPVSNIFYVSEQKLLEGKPEDEQLFSTERLELKLL